MTKLELILQMDVKVTRVRVVEHGHFLVNGIYAGYWIDGNRMIPKHESKRLHFQDAKFSAFRGN